VAFLIGGNNMITLCILGYIIVSFILAASFYGEHWDSGSRRYERTSWNSALKIGFSVIPGFAMLIGLLYCLLWLAGGALTGIIEAAIWIYENMP
jgi:hypothetical protein